MWVHRGHEVGDDRAWGLRVGGGGGSGGLKARSLWRGMPESVYLCKSVGGGGEEEGSMVQV